ncbi:hypothetical protein [Metabacillus litoralis]|jgi:anti-repressor protein|uniref:hypothetical protein n=1 Tax=Metabacillus litoralis TaxID=152268 RepID=UPI00203BDB88|nr:hypothetical protein [Metabacillus litoralis]MCM3653972.1 hypothetical protein [Metabacillus litoralis]
MQSRKLIARQFKKRVKEILKSIRKDDGYIATNEEDDDATIMAKALLVAQKTIDKKSKQLEVEHKKIVEDRPKVLLIEKIIATNVWIIM